MTRNWLLIFVGTVTCAGLSGPAGAEQPTPAAPRAAAACENAAVIYWQAFDFMPRDPQDEKAKEWRDFHEAGNLKFTTISPELRQLIGRFQLSLHQLQRAYPVTRCDWHHDYEAGPSLWLTHLQSGRTLERAALWRARLRFQDAKKGDGKTDEAVADGLAVLKLARDCGGSPLMVAMLVDMVMEREAINVLAANLPRLDSQQLDKLSLALAQLPRTASLADGVKMEEEMFCGWLSRRIDTETAGLKDGQTGGDVMVAIFKEFGGEREAKGDPAEADRRRALIKSMSVQEVRDALAQMRQDYQAMAAIAAAPHAEQPARWREFEAGLATAQKLKGRDDLRRIFSVQLLPTTGSVYDREEEMLARRELFALALKVQAHGPEALQGAKVLGRPDIEFKKTKTGFELTHTCAGSKKKVALTVGTGG